MGTTPVAAEPPAPVIEEAPEVTAVVEAAAPEPVAPEAAAPEPVALEAAPEPAAAEVPVAVEPAPAEPPAEPTAEELGVDQQMDRFASLAEEVVFEAEAMAGEAAHNFQMAVEAAASGIGMAPVMGGMNDYLRRSVQINSQFMQQFSTVRTPLDLVSLQVRFLEEHRVAMLEFAKRWSPKKPAA